MNDRKLPPIVTGLIASAFFLENLDATVISVALPVIASSFGVASTQVAIGMSAYMLAVALGLAASVWMVNRFGTRRLFVGGVLVFAAGSLWCGRSTSLEMFIGARLLQGLGGAMMVSVSRFVLFHNTPKNRLLRTVALVTWPAFVAPVIGPPLGGFIATHFGWNWIFYLNLPLAAAAAWVGWTRLPEHGPGQAHRFDALGFVLVGSSLTLALTTFELAGHQSAGGPALAYWGAAGLLTGGLTVWHLRKAKAPLLSLAAFRINTFAVAALSGLCYRITIGGLTVLLPLMFQLGLGMTPLQSGYLILTFFLGNLAVQPFITRIISRFGFRSVIAWNGAFTCAQVVALAFFTQHASVWILVALLVVSGASRALQFMALNTLAICDLPAAQTNDAASVSGVMQHLNTGIGIALGAMALNVAVQLLQPTATYPLETFRLALCFIAAAAAVSSAIALHLPQGAGAEVSGSRLR